MILTLLLKERDKFSLLILSPLELRNSDAKGKLTTSIY
uniref:Uncharacterized protein n=1 Tax=Rhizophora mucronata TaxID=61149 RepID=A0A2P2PX19_RHIMU